MFNGQGPLVEEAMRVWQNNGRRLEVTYTMAAIGDDQNDDLLEQLAARIAELTDLVADEFDTMIAASALTDPGLQWSVSIVMETENAGPSLVEVFGHEFGISRRFTSPDMVREHLPRSLVKALTNAVQSAGQLNIENLTFDVRYDSNYRPAARGKIKSFVRKTIASDDHTKGLAKYAPIDGYCGFQAVVYMLASERPFREHWTGSLHWFDSEFTEARPHMQQLRRSKRRFLTLARRLAEQVHGDADLGEWVLADNADSTANKLVRLQPKLQVVIYNEVTRQKMDIRRGLQFDPTYAHECTLLMSYTLGHVQLILHPFPYFGKPMPKHRETFCYCCLDFKVSPQHACSTFVAVQCDKCLVIFNNADHRREHCQYDRSHGVRCESCQYKFYNDRCLAAHRCTAKGAQRCGQCGSRIMPYVAHTCGQFRCTNCSELVDRTHLCYIQREDEPPFQTPSEAGAEYYAFDLESMTTPMPDGSRLHQVNLAVVCKCFSAEPPLIFHSLQDFEQWISQSAKPIVLFAHNLKGYDGRLVFEYLFDKHQPPQEIMWRGSKIMKMTYGKATFMDTLLHLPASLDQLPGMFGLDENQFKKGFFPHRFNVPENQHYVGAFPSAEYFDPQRMSPKKRQAFNDWYAQHCHERYDFAKELVEYCVSDTLILARAMEAYMTQQMATRVMNPFSRTTIASYAMHMYRTYFMPEKQLARLTAVQHDDISSAMHGGRTDARCLLHEWTAEEVARGLYGKYQDVQSLYPTVQFYDPLPVGHTTKTVWLNNEQPSLEQLRQVFGFVCCDIECTRYLHHPVIVELDKESGLLVADLKPKERIVVPTPELQLALDNGYRVTRVYYWYHFESSTDLFKSYFREFLARKIKASGMPKWVTDDATWREFQQYHEHELGIVLDRADMQKNSAAKTGAKLLCNSLWGKFGERSQPYQWARYMQDDQDDAIMKLENMWIDGLVDIVYRKYSGDNRAVGMVFKHNKSLPGDHIYKRMERGHKNIALAAMITSHARCRLWHELNKLGDRVLYHDTDSIIYEHQPGQYNIPEGRYLGEWEDETDGMPIVSFVSTGPKCYSYIVQKPDGSFKKETKAKGITLHSENTERIHYDSMKKLVTGELDVIEADNLLFKYNRNEGQMTTKNVIKLFKNTYSKGYVHPQTYRVFPFGWEQFLDRATMLGN